MNKEEAMQQSAITIPPEYVQLIEERKRIRVASLESRQQADMLEQLADRISAPETSEDLAPLTSQATPPQEVAAALLKLEEELAHIKQTEAHIQQHQTSIEKIKQRAIILMVALIGCGVALASALLYFVLHMFHIF